MIPKAKGSHCQLKRQGSPLSLGGDSDVEIIDAGEEAQPSRDMEVINIDEESSSDVEILGQPGSGAVVSPGNALARAMGDRTAAEPEEDSEVTRSEMDIALFCFDELERSLVLPVRNEDHGTGGTDDFEGKLQVRFILQMIDNIPISNLFRWLRLQCGPMLQVLLQ